MEQALYRIIDANFNRAREGCRVMEEYCRFYLDDQVLSSRAKQIRHRISSTVGLFDHDRLIISRNSSGDVGRSLQVKGQLARNSLDDCMLAAAKRVTEALRAMAETSQSICQDAYVQFEDIRFECYELEKAITLRQPAMRFGSVRLYVLITVTPEIPSGKYSNLIDQCIDGGADCLQLRAKGLQGRKIYELGNELVRKCSSAGIISIINDRTDIAIACNADGFHLGQEDLPVEMASKQIRKPMITGLSTHNPDQLTEAIKIRPQYVGIGPAFRTSTKPHEKTAGLEYIKHAVENLEGTGIEHVAIGGINKTNIDSVIQAGAKKIAVCSAVTESTNPVSACRNLKEKLKASE